MSGVSPRSGGHSLRTSFLLALSLPLAADPFYLPGMSCLQSECGRGEGYTSLWTRKGGVGWSQDQSGSRIEHPSQTSGAKARYSQARRSTLLSAPWFQFHAWAWRSCQCTIWKHYSFSWFWLVSITLRLTITWLSGDGRFRWHLRTSLWALWSGFSEFTHPCFSPNCTWSAAGGATFKTPPLTWMLCHCLSASLLTF